MNRTDYLTDGIISKMSAIRDRAKVRDNNITRDREGLSTFLTEHGQTIEVMDTIDDLRNEYLGACLASDSERSAEMFRDNGDLREINVDYFLGKHDRVRGVISREYEGEDDETTYNHLLVEHIHENPHIEGVKRMAHAYARLTYADQTD